MYRVPPPSHHQFHRIYPQVWIKLAHYGGTLDTKKLPFRIMIEGWRRSYCPKKKIEWHLIYAFVSHLIRGVHLEISFVCRVDFQSNYNSFFPLQIVTDSSLGNALYIRSTLDRCRSLWSEFSQAADQMQPTLMAIWYGWIENEPSWGLYGVRSFHLSNL